MNTKRLFRDDVYRKEASAVVTAIEAFDGSTAIILDETVFFPEGGGQSGDIGFVGPLKVCSVVERGDEILHIVDAFDDEIKVGDRLNISIDWEHRFDEMQRHCGEHILSGAIFKLFGGENRGFHMGDDYMTIDIFWDKDSEFKEFTPAMAKEAELSANETIWQNLPVSVHYFQSKDDADLSSLHMRKQLTFERDISIVNIGTVESPADCVACCGTHPSSTGQVGLLKIYKIEPNKGMWRIFFEAGRRAFLKYDSQLDSLSFIEKDLSAGDDDVLVKYRKFKEKSRELGSTLYSFRRNARQHETDALRDALSQCSDHICRYYDEPLSIDDLLAIGRELCPLLHKLLFLVHKPSNTVLLFSSGNAPYLCGNLVKENASIYNGKGGGSPTCARAIFSKEDYVPTFIDLIIKHLQ